MLPASTFQKKGFSSHSNVKTNPPISSIMEQCYWGRSLSHYIHVHEYNDRRRLKHQQRLRPSTSETRNGSLSQLTKRPWTSQIKRSSPELMNVTGESAISVERSFDIDEKSSSSRSFAPDYTTDLYQALTGQNNHHVLLRRPVAHSPSHFAETDEFVELAADSEKVDCECAVVDTSTNTDDGRESPKPKKSVNYEISIPSATYDCWDVGSCDEHEASDISEHESTFESEPKENADLNACRLKPPLRPKKKLKNKKKIKPKRKAFDLTPVTVDYSEQNNRDEPDLEAKTSTTEWRWVNKEDEIVTQMFALGLSTPLHEEDLKFDPKSHRVARPRSSPNVLRLKAKSSLKDSPKQSKKPSVTMQSDRTVERARTIPIQIISDPFKCTRNMSPSHTKPKRRPQSASPYITARVLPEYWK
ncbi:uncharacterized protein LOC143448244 isoform X1 [Clavelina lepadiformis]|uniref:uncharacterized protein LOC143448244 isoform X1 n=1 Tax=Clavelina lepadiformis TaxID=159417 RepID=UPI0040417E74